MTRRALVVALLAGACLAGGARGDTVRYVLTEESRLIPVCPTCDPAGTAPQPLRGSFDLSRMPAPAQVSVDAVTGVRWANEHTRITGSGFLQRLAEDRTAMVVDARFNGVPLLLTSGSQPRAPAGEIRLQLSTPTGGGNGIRILLVAVPAPPGGRDRDLDGVIDGDDNCPQAANPLQADDDGDGVGEACDRCPATSLGAAVLADGCDLAQACPCDGPSEDALWADPREYVQCVARHLKRLRQQGGLGRSEIRQLLQDAVRSGCGRHVLALR